ncbi:putative integral membrane protein [Podospora didyma]|uniref:Integral membrane protein n=1 Tax=Podospora didyma TaxID=330526 RepID=A0AAE0N6W2_9PEZI|nr:putative integral membrane protein [Podospora didyma]
MTYRYIDASANPQGVLINGLVWFMLILATISVVLRVYCKLIRRRALWWDDYFLISAWIFLTASCCCTTANIRLGFGLHIYEVPLENMATLGLISNISGFTSVIAVDLSKTSFAITLLRLTDGKLRWLVWFIIVVLNLTQMMSAVFFWASCDPPAKIWNPMLEGTCWPASFSIISGLVAGVLSVLADFSLALLPWRLLLRFHMYRREKIGVAIAMSVGVFAGITCIVKLTTLPLLAKGDFTYHGTPLVLWGFAEVVCTIIAASIPTMRALFHNPSKAHDLPSLRVDITAKTGPEAANNQTYAELEDSQSNNESTFTVATQNEQLGRDKTGGSPSSSRKDTSAAYELDAFENSRA